MLTFNKQTLFLILCPLAVVGSNESPKSGNLRSLQNECEQTKDCVLNGGTCVKTWECSGICKDDLCNSDECTCQIEEQCPMTEQCRSFGTGGICTRDCVAIPGVVDCIENICELKDCKCKTCLHDDVCLDHGGECLLKEDCLREAEATPDLDCRPELCGSFDEDCACLVPSEPCPTTQECLSLNGVCIKDCVAIPGVSECDDLCNSEEDCLCKNCLQNDERCVENQGKCLLLEDCKKWASIDPNLVCDPELCSGDEPNEECACLTRKPATESPTPSPTKSPTPRPTPRPTGSPTSSPIRSEPCPVTPECRGVNGECVKDCVPISGVVQCDVEMCNNQDCECKSCVFNEECRAVDGKCLLLEDCEQRAALDPSLICDPDLCSGDEHSDDCACLRPSPCPKTPSCQSHNGECVKDCVPIPGLVRCDFELCSNTFSADSCECKFCETTPACDAAGGTCLLFEDCEQKAALDPNFVCKPELCTGDEPNGEPSNECACLLPSPPPCDDTQDCLEWNGKCTKDCVNSPSGEFECGDECHSEECKCLKCKKSELCAKMNGVCVPLCEAGPGEVCDPELCDHDGDLTNSPCSCKLKIDDVVVSIIEP